MTDYGIVLSALNELNQCHGDEECCCVAHEALAALDRIESAQPDIQTILECEVELAANWLERKGYVTAAERLRRDRPSPKAPVNGPVAQGSEQGPHKPTVAGSNPAGSTSNEAPLLRCVTCGESTLCTVGGMYCMACWERRGSMAVPPIIEDFPGEAVKDCLTAAAPPSGKMSDGGQKNASPGTASVFPAFNPLMPYTMPPYVGHSNQSNDSALIATALERIAACMELSAAKEPR